MTQIATKREPDYKRRQRDGGTSARIVLVAPVPPPYGGMALQAKLLERLLRGDGHDATLFASNFALPAGLGFLEKIPGLRTLIRAIMIWPKLWVQAAGADVIHVLAASWLYFFLVVYPAGIVARLRGARFILNYRGGGAERFFRFYGWAVNPILRCAHEVTAPSEFLAGEIGRRFGVPVSIVPNVLDNSLFQYRQRIALRPAILVNRHLEKIYAIEAILQGFGVVQQRYPQAFLWIAGTGSEEQKLRKLVAASNLHNVRFLGHVTHREIAGIYDQCDILMNASQIDNFPAALIEASAAGLVVISTCAGGIPSIYRHGESALLVPVGDWQGLARAVQTVLESPALAAGLTKAALHSVQAYEWNEVRKSVYKAYGFDLRPDSEPTCQDCLTTGN